jgi:hypothetical protein
MFPPEEGFEGKRGSPLVPHGGTPDSGARRRIAFPAMAFSG